MAERVEIAQLTIDLDQTVEESARLLKIQNSLKKELKDLRTEGKESTAEYAKLDAQLRKVSKQYTDQRKVVTALLSVNEDLNDVIATENKSTTELRNSRNQLITLAQSIKGNTEEEIKLRKQLNDAIDNQTKVLREQSSEFVTGKDSVGEYAQAIEKAIPSNSLLGRAISTVKDILNIVTPIYKVYSTEIKASVANILAAAKGTEGLTKAQKAQVVITRIATNALKLFRIALISTGIGAILVALGSLVAFLGSTQAGIDKVNRVLKPLEVIFGRLFGFLQKFGERLFNAFKNPQKLIEDLGKKIKENLETRLNAVVRIFNRIRDLDFKGIGEDLSQAATGIENIGEKTRQFFSDAKQFLQESIDLGLKLAEIQVQIEENENANIIRVAELNRLIKEQNKIAEDVTKSQQEREAAALRTIEASKEILALEQAQLDLKIQQKEIENSLNDTSREDQKELNELIAERIEKETQALELQTTQTNKLNTIRREIANEAKKRADEEAKRQREEALQAVKNAELELEIFKEKNKELLEADGELLASRINAALAAAEFIRDEELAIVQDKLDKQLISEREAELARLQIRNDFRAKEAAALEEFQEFQDEREKERREKEEERLAFENEKRLELRELTAEDEFLFRQEQLERERQQELAEAEKLGADKTAIEKKFNIKKEQLDIARRQAQTDQAIQGFNEFADLASAFFGDNKALSTALALADTFLGAQKAYLSQLIPGDPTSLARATGAAVKATVFGLANVAKVSGVKFAGGGLWLTGGKDHGSGGTKYIGEDGGRFEVERGEVMGVMNKKAAKHFMAFNNMFRSGRSKSNFFQGGGLFGSSSSAVQSGLTATEQSRLANQEAFNYDLLASKIAQANMELPAPILDVTDFHEVNDKVTTVEAGANV